MQIHNAARASTQRPPHAWGAGGQRPAGLAPFCCPCRKPLLYHAAVRSSLVSLNAHFAQYIALRALEAAARPRRVVPLMYPRCRVATEGSPVAGFYSEIFVRGLYESPKPLPPRPRIVDVGGHLGLASLFFLSRYPGCQLTTIEPNPNLTACLRQTLAPFGARVRLLEAALATQQGTVPFHVTADNPLNVTGGIANREAPGREVLQITVPSLDARDVLAEPVDLLKLDVEGHEFELLPLPIFEPSHVRNLVVEFHDVERSRDRFVSLVELLTGRGYRFASSNDVTLSADELRALSGCPVLKLY